MRILYSTGKKTVRSSDLPIEIDYPQSNPDSKQSRNQTKSKGDRSLQNSVSIQKGEVVQDLTLLNFQVSKETQYVFRQSKRLFGIL